MVVIYLDRISTSKLARFADPVPSATGSLRGNLLNTSIVGFPRLLNCLRLAKSGESVIISVYAVKAIVELVDEKEQDAQGY